MQYFTVFLLFLQLWPWVNLCNQSAVPLCLAVCDALLFCSSVQWGVISSLEIRSFLSTSNLRMQRLQELIPCKPVSGF